MRRRRSWKRGSERRGLVLPGGGDAAADLVEPVRHQIADLGTLLHEYQRLSVVRPRVGILVMFAFGEALGMTRVVGIT